MQTAQETSSTIATAVAIFSSSRVLLIKRAFEPMMGRWTLPGGRLEAEETLDACAIREIREELDLHVSQLLPVTSFVFGGFTLNIFATRTYDGTPSPSSEVADWQWRAPEDVVTLETTPRLIEFLRQAEKAVTDR